jgi:hypothetical protein
MGEHRKQNEQEVAFVPDTSTPRQQLTSAASLLHSVRSDGNAANIMLVCSSSASATEVASLRLCSLRDSVLLRNCSALRAACTVSTTMKCAIETIACW